jgi:UDP-N-acetylmuramoyl-L-alanyl-D-glutamate--2,6-diaminopimelate ligase
MIYLMGRYFDEIFSPALTERAGLEWNGTANPLITGAVYDSRRVEPGNLYFALPGIHTDGRRYIDEALRRGAAAVLYQGELPPGALPPTGEAVFVRARDSRAAMAPVSASLYDNPSAKLGLIGVTGTEGKSTTVYLIWQLLRALGKKAGFVSTVQYSEGAEARDNPHHETTPEAPVIQRSLARIAEEGGEYAVLEASSHGLSSRLNRLGECAFDAAVMTGVTHEHLEFHGTWEQYRDDKANLFRALDRFGHDKGAVAPISAFGVVNADDPSAAYFAAATDKEVLSFSLRGAEADLSVIALESGSGGNRYRVRAFNREEIDIEDRLPGTFNVGNVLAALITVSRICALPLGSLVPLVPGLLPVRGRMTAVECGQPFRVLVDYAHTPSSFEAIFPSLRAEQDRLGKRIIALFGSAGERDTQKRPLQGAVAARYSDRIILCDEDPRGEDPMQILEEIAAGIGGTFRRGTDLFLIPPRTEAIRAAFRMAEPGDLVLLLGKGHENSIIYQDGPHPYDEITTARQWAHQWA